MVWSDITATMTRVYAGPFTIPDTAGPVDVTLSAPFRYSGRSMYVAYEFQSPGPFTTQNAVFASNTNFNNSTRSGFSSSEQPAVLNVVSDFRPVIRFGFPMPAFQWYKITSGMQMDLNGLDIVDDSSAWVCSSAGVIYRTIDQGNTWLDAASVPDSAFAILGIASDIAVAIAGKESGPSAIYLTSDGDSSWTRVYEPHPPMRIALAGRTSRDIWCLGESIDDSVILLTSQDRGSTWTRSFAGAVLPPGAHLTSSCTVGFVVWLGAADRVYRVENDLMGPWKVSSTGRPNIRAIAFSSASGTGIATHIGCIDTIRRSTDGGLTWSAVAVAGLGEVSSLQDLSPGVRMPGQLRQLASGGPSDDGLTWQRSFSTGSSSQTLSSIRFFSNFQSGLAIGLNDLIVRGSWLVNQLVAVSESHSQPEGYRLGLNYPNPFNGQTWIEFSLPRLSLVTLIVFDVLGRQIVTLASGEKGGGTYRVEWNSAGNPSGVYFCRLHARAISGGMADDYIEVHKLILLK